jgi:hypothetical protein
VSVSVADKGKSFPTLPLYAGYALPGEMFTRLLDESNKLDEIIYA